MGVVNIPGGGGGGILSEELGATAEFVLKDLSYVGNDTDDEAGTGKMPNIGAQTGALNCGESVDISKGYHDGTGKITANSLASQTSATATAARILKGDTAWVNGVKLTGTVEVSSIPSFSVAAYSTSQLTFTWKNPAAATGRPFSGVIICCKTGSYPTGPTDGFKYMGTGSNSAAGGTSSVTLSGFTAGTTYYCRIWAYCVCSAGNYTINSTKVLVSSTYMSATGKPTASGRKAFTASGTWTVPDGVRTIKIHCTGGGGSGAYTRSSYSNNAGAGGGGAGGYTAYKTGIAVTPGQVIDVIVGAGGDLGAGGESRASLNGTVLVSAAGGGYAQKKGTDATSTSSTSYYRVGGEGGSGGGCGGTTGDSEDDGTAGANGASNGANGPKLGTLGYGAGQGTTTREFGNSSGTLYSGGGGGGGGYWSWAEHPGYGGSGGGGNGGYGSTYDIPANGSAGTGGGGGGGLVKGYGAGGTGNVIIAW